MSCQITFLIVRRVLGLLRLGPAPDEKDIEIAVFRPPVARAETPGGAASLLTGGPGLARHARAAAVG
jgi:hypothetical protein